MPTEDVSARWPETGSDDAGGALAEAREYAQIGDLDRADAELRRLVPRGGQVGIDARVELIYNAARRHRQWDRVLRLCEEYLSEFPGDERVLRVQGRAVLEMGHGAEAVRILRVALAANPKSDLARADMVAAQLGTGDLPGAIDTMVGFPDPSSKAAVKAGALVALARHDSADAAHRLGALANREGWDVETANNLAVAYAGLHKLAEARHMLDMAAQLASSTTFEGMIKGNLASMAQRIHDLEDVDGPNLQDFGSSPSYRSLQALPLSARVSCPID